MQGENGRGDGERGPSGLDRCRICFRLQASWLTRAQGDLEGGKGQGANVELGVPTCRLNA